MWRVAGERVKNKNVDSYCLEMLTIVLLYTMKFIPFNKMTTFHIRRLCAFRKKCELCVDVCFFKIYFENFEFLDSLDREKEYTQNTYRQFK